MAITRRRPCPITIRISFGHAFLRRHLRRDVAGECAKGVSQKVSRCSVAQSSKHAVPTPTVQENNVKDTQTHKAAIVVHYRRRLSLCIVKPATADSPTANRRYRSSPALTITVCRLFPFRRSQLPRESYCPTRTNLPQYFSRLEQASSHQETFLAFERLFVIMFSDDLKKLSIFHQRRMRFDDWRRHQKVWTVDTPLLTLLFQSF